MRPIRTLLFVSVAIGMSTPAQAGIFFFKKHPKVDPAPQIPALIAQLRTDAVEKKREAAAEELRKFDPAQFPEVLAALIDAAQSDPKAGVRTEALNTLAKYRPVSQQVGATLEQVMERDNSLRLRLHARSLLVQYHLAGYRSAKTGPLLAKDGPSLGSRTDEPPLADPPAEIPAASTGLIAPRSPIARPLPVGSPVETPVLIPPPSAGRSDGPQLSPRR